MELAVYAGLCIIAHLFFYNGEKRIDETDER